MIYIFVSHKVKDFNKWKEVYDSHNETRNEFGLETTKIFRSVYEPDNIHVLVSSPSVETFEEFSEKGDLKGIMEKAGVTGEPVFNFLQLT